MISETMTFVGKHKYLMLPFLPIYYGCDAISSLYIGAGCVCYESVVGKSSLICSNNSINRPEYSPDVTPSKFVAVNTLFIKHEEFSDDVSNALHTGMFSSFDYKYFIFVFTIIELFTHPIFIRLQTQRTSPMISAE